MNAADGKQMADAICQKLSEERSDIAFETFLSETRKQGECLGKFKKENEVLVPHIQYGL